MRGPAVAKGAGKSLGQTLAGGLVPKPGLTLNGTVTSGKAKLFKSPFHLPLVKISESFSFLPLIMFLNLEERKE